MLPSYSSTDAAVAHHVAAEIIEETGVAKMNTWVGEGPRSFRVFACVGGALMIAQGLFGFFNQFLSLSLLHAVLYIYIFFFGIVVLILEGRGPLYPASWKRHIQTQAKFLTLLNGRGASYAFMGTILCTLPGWGSVLLGLCMIGLGCTMFVLGLHAKTKVSSSGRMSHHIRIRIARKKLK